MLSIRFEPRLDITQTYDGLGLPAKREQISRLPGLMDESGNTGAPIEDTQTTHYVRSTVLGGATIAELGPSNVIHIYAGGQRIARDVWGNVTFEHHNPVTGTWVTSHGHSSYRLTGREERDPRGAELPLSNPYGDWLSYAEMKFAQPLFIEGGDPFDYVSGYTLDGLPMSRSQLNRIRARTGIGQQLWFDVFRGKNIDDFPVPFLTYYDSFYVELQDDRPRKRNAPTVKNAKPDQQSRFNDAYNEFWDRLHENDGKNPCAELFGGIKNAEEALKDTKYTIGKPREPTTGAQLANKTITINPNGLFMSTDETVKLQVGYNLKLQQGYYVVLNPVQAAAFVLAHEIGHRANKLKPDGHDRLNFLSIMNNAKVRKACFSDLAEVIGPLSLDSP